jgi:DNA-binding transcriptional MerR regulator
VNEISKKDIPDITTEGYLYLTKEGMYNFVLDKNCAYLLGVFDFEKKRVFQEEYDSIKEKSKLLLNLHNDLTKAKAALMYQKMVETYLSVDSDEYKKSSELLTYFEQKLDELKRQTDELEKEIETMIHEYILKELRILTSENVGIKIQGTLNHYLEFFINKKYYKYI